MFLLDGSTWKVNDPNSENAYKWIFDSFQPFIYKGVGMDMVRGREMGRSYREDYTAGFDMIGIIATMAQFAPKNYTSAIKSMLKYWITSNTQRNYLEYAVKAKGISVNTIFSVENIINDPNVAEYDELLLCKQYSAMDRSLKLGAGYGFGISMHSSRIANYEADIKNENKKGWHTADGMTYLYNADLNQYNNAFWPTVDNYRLPGTTVLQATPIANDKISDCNWVGGVSLQNKYGVTGMDYHAYGFNLRAKKSWFMFDNEIVSLGAGISGNDNKEVETIVENRKLNPSGNNRLTVNGKVIKPNLSSTAKSLNQVTWTHLSGNVACSDIGYYFPDKANLNSLRESRTANWNSINGNPAMSDTISYTNNFLTLWFDHGSNPISGTYSYALLPGMSVRQVKSYAKNPQVLVLRNDTAIQAVKETNLNIIGANFWTDTDQTVDIVSCNKKASAMIRITGKEMEQWRLVRQHCRLVRLFQIIRTQ